MDNTLAINGLTVRIGEKTVVNDVSIAVEAGRIVSVLGPNGAGKSEMVLAVAGVMEKSAGSIAVNGLDVTNHAPQQVRSAGIAAVPEGHQVLTTLSVDDNVSAAGAMLSAAELDSSRDEVYAVFPELKQLMRQKAGSLSGGQQQMVALAQALVCRPDYLLIDEMSLGLAPIIIERLMDIIVQLKQKGLGILLIEQFTHLALEISDRCYVLNRGEVHFVGLPTELKSDPTILQNAYLGLNDAVLPHKSDRAAAL